MCRIQLEDTVKDIMLKMSEGNPGALTVLLQCFQNGGAIDPDDFAGGLGPALSMDSNGIYGSRIWCLYKDVCGEDLRTMIAVLRSVQLGFVPITQLNSAIANYGRGIDVPAVVLAVEKRLPAFQRA